MSPLYTPQKIYPEKLHLSNGPFRFYSKPSLSLLTQIQGLRSHVSSSSSPAPHGNNRAAVHACDSSTRIMLPAVLHRSPCRDRHSSCSPGPVTHCRDRLVVAPCRDARARRRSLDAWNTQETEEHQLAAGGDQARPSVCAGGDQVAAERLYWSRSGGGRASVPVEIMWRPSVRIGQDQAAAERVRRWRSGRCAGRQVRAACWLRWQAGAAFHASQSRPLTIEQHANAVQQKQLTPRARRPAAASRPGLLLCGSSPRSLQGSGREDEETPQIDDQVRTCCMSFRYV
jgi:hypothetical protein